METWNLTENLNLENMSATENVAQAVEVVAAPTCMESVNRIAKLPVVESTLQTAQGIYEKVKVSPPLTFNDCFINSYNLGLQQRNQLDLANSREYRLQSRGHCETICQSSNQEL